MLFNSYEFIFAFLPFTWLIYRIILGARYAEASIAWLVLASLFFYGWWNPAYLFLIVASMSANFIIGLFLEDFSRPPVLRKALLILGVSLNLGLLGYYKYTGFILENAIWLFHISIDVPQIVLPLAISFFTFQQIAYLSDAYRGEMKEYNFLHYCLFVSFFPQLIAGPIVHHKEMMPQFASIRGWSVRSSDYAAGLSFFIIGLFKKVVIADNLALFATPVFDAADSGASLSMFVAWSGALAYTFQLYFDFSGYADMAIGAARLFGIRLPFNFNSPYKAKNITEFWRRWHMTLSRFLRDYLYIPLGGNRKGANRRYVNLMITMLLGGLWHGAGWNFVIWGALHGGYLVINHGWHSLSRKLTFTRRLPLGRWSSSLAISLTFFAVVIGWVFFRAETTSGAFLMLESMLAINSPEEIDVFHNLGPGFCIKAGIWILPAALVALLLPNSQEMIDSYKASNQYSLGSVCIPSLSAGAWALAVSVMYVVALVNLGGLSEFLYFQF